MNTNIIVLKKIRSIILAIVVALIGALPYLLFNDQIQQMAGLGYIGLFVACLLTNASICLPASGIAFTLAAATALNPFWCALVGGMGTAVGELVGYVFGRSVSLFYPCPFLILWDWPPEPQDYLWFAFSLSALWASV